MLLSTADSRTFPPEAGFILSRVDVSGRGLAGEVEWIWGVTYFLNGSLNEEPSNKRELKCSQEQKKGIFFPSYVPFKQNFVTKINFLLYFDSPLCLSENYQLEPVGISPLHFYSCFSY